MCNTSYVCFKVSMNHFVEKKSKYFFTKMINKWSFKMTTLKINNKLYKHGTRSFTKKGG